MSTTLDPSSKSLDLADRDRADAFLLENFHDDLLAAADAAGLADDDEVAADPPPLSPPPSQKIRRSVSWKEYVRDKATKRIPSWKRIPSTPETPSKSLKLAFGVESPVAKGRKANGHAFLGSRRLVALLVAVVVVCGASRWRRRDLVLRRRREAEAAEPIAVALVAAAISREASEQAPRRRQIPVVAAVARIRRECRLVSRRPLGHVACAVRRFAALVRAELTKHVLKLVVLVGLGFSPVPFLLSFV